MPMVKCRRMKLTIIPIPVVLTFLSFRVINFNTAEIIEVKQ